MNYGRQRVWGSIGFGTTAFLAGYAMDWWSGDDEIKSYTPAFVLIIIFILIDLFCCSKLKVIFYLNKFLIYFKFDNFCMKKNEYI